MYLHFILICHYAAVSVADLHLCTWKTLLSQLTFLDFFIQVNIYILLLLMHSLGIKPMTLVLLAAGSRCHLVLVGRMLYFGE